MVEHVRDLIKSLSAGDLRQLLAIKETQPEIEKLMQNPRYDGVLVACKAADFRWPTFNAVLKARFSGYEMSSTELTQARADFIKLSVATARRMFRFWLVRGVAKADP